MTAQSQNGHREKPFIFLSYAHADRELVFPHVLRFREQGLRIWWDEGIRPGKAWIQAIADAIVNCSAFLLLVTRGVATSEYCFREVLFAQDEGIYTVVSFLESVQLPNRLRFLLSPVHAVINGPNDQRLIETLHRAVDEVGSRTAPDVGSGWTPRLDKWPGRFPVVVGPQVTGNCGHERAETRHKE